MRVDDRMPAADLRIQSEFSRCRRSINGTVVNAEEAQLVIVHLRAKK
jgi:hypothetical protein